MDRTNSILVSEQNYLCREKIFHGSLAFFAYSLKKALTGVCSRLWEVGVGQDKRE